MTDVSCDWSRLKDKTPSATDKELECANIMDGGDSWAEDPLRHPKLAHIKICYALHALCTHINWSIPDVLRINDFSIESSLPSSSSPTRKRTGSGGGISMTSRASRKCY